VRGSAVFDVATEQVAERWWHREGAGLVALAPDLDLAPGQVKVTQA
jgi:hypothetical protein